MNHRIVAHNKPEHKIKLRKLEDWETSVSAIDKIFAYQGAQGFELHERKTKSIDYIVRASAKLR